MLKKVVCLLMVLCMAISFPVCAEGFSDVSKENPYYDAITSLSKKGIINGYEDSTFRPEGNITRAEAAAVITRAAEISESSAESVYYDVKNDFWACGYIMAATEEGIINGYPMSQDEINDVYKKWSFEDYVRIYTNGYKKFVPQDNVTYNQIIKMVVCMLGLEDIAENKGGYPFGYTEVAYKNNIVDKATYNSIINGEMGDLPALRQHVANFIYNAFEKYELNSIYVGKTKLSLEMSKEELDTPDEILPSTAGFDWYVYGTDTYKDFYSVGVEGDKVIIIAAAGPGFTYSGYSCGDIVANKDDFPNYLYFDSNDDDILHAVFIFDGEILFDRKPKGVPTAKQLSGESKMNFHFTNAFRVFHKKRPFEWSSRAAESARLHSEDMAENNYFSHTALNGTSPGNRMNMQNINWSYCGENIAAGTTRFLGFTTYDAWVNSSGHRTNMLNDFDFLGVGIAYNPDSKLTYYHTQNFFSEGWD